MVSEASFRASAAKLLGKSPDDPAVTKMVRLEQLAEQDPSSRQRWLRGEIDEYGNPTPRNPAAVDAAFERFRQTAAPALFLERVDRPTRSRVGGLPDLPPGLGWPSPAGTPLAFLAQLDCSEFPGAARLDWLPSTGTLFCFVAPRDGMTCAGDRSASSVLFAPEQGGKFESAPIGPVSPPRSIAFRLLPSFKQGSRYDQAGVIHPDDDLELWRRARELEVGRPVEGDQIGGWVMSLQIDNMPLECDEIASGLRSGDPDYPRKRQQLLSRTDLDWRLLLRLDLSDMARWLVEDGSSHVYFWVRESDARRRDFSKVILLAEAD